MSESERPLPNPPGTPFGRKKKFEGEEEKETLLADKIAMAMAEGRLDEFMEKELPGGEHARALTMMMMGMSGMLPPGASGDTGAVVSGGKGKEAPQEETPGIQPPEDVVKAVEAGDVKGLMGLLEREFRKLNPDAAPPEPEKGGALPEGETAAEKEVIDQLLQIARENNLSLDWVILRALKVYIEEHRKTGRL